MNLQDLKNKARRAMYRHYEPTTLNRWISERKAFPMQFRNSTDWLKTMKVLIDH